jgi:hypothetical protein
MAAIAHADVRAYDRRTYQEEVETLLEQIGRATSHLRFMKAGGATAQALADLKQDLVRARERLAALTSARP